MFKDKDEKEIYKKLFDKLEKSTTSLAGGFHFTPYKAPTTASLKSATTI